MTNSELYSKVVETIDLACQHPDRHNALLKLKLDSCDSDKLTMRFVFEVDGPWCLNPYDCVHGGVISSLFDTSMGIGAVALTDGYVTTTDLSINYIKPFSGKKYYFDIEYTHIGNKMIRILGRAQDAETGVLCATAMGGYMRISMK